MFLALFVRISCSIFSVSLLRKSSNANVNAVFVGDSITFFYPCISLNICTPYKVVLPKGKIKLETWGGDGASVNSNAGGKGGYSSGILSLSKPTIAYINIAGKGLPLSSEVVQYGGYNGGGNGQRDPTSGHYGVGGGGSTDIRIGMNSVYNRVIVSGGGGGAGAKSGFIGGCGGGTEGCNGVFNQADYEKYKCVVSGGTQSSNGRRNSFSSQYDDFWKGQSMKVSDNSGWGSGGGGGGWFGGSSGCVFSSSGAGGSGYVFTNESHVINYYRLSKRYQLSEATTVDGNSGIPAVQRDGNGAAKITFIDIDEGFVITCPIRSSQTHILCLMINILLSA